MKSGNARNHFIHYPDASPRPHADLPVPDRLARLVKEPRLFAVSPWFAEFRDFTCQRLEISEQSEERVGLYDRSVVFFHAFSFVYNWLGRPSLGDWTLASF